MKKQHPPSLIDVWLEPGARLLERHESHIAAPPERAYEAIRQVKLAEMPIVRALFTVRRIPHSKAMTLQEFFSTPPFLILEEGPEREVVIGIAGWLWRHREHPSTPDEFRAIAKQGTMQAIANFRVDTTDSGSLISTETWVATFGTMASWLFRAYWLIVGPFSALIRREFLRVTRKMAEEG